MEASYSISHKDSEYRILLTPVRLDVLSDVIYAYVCNMSTHQVTGITNTPIRLDNYDESGKGYSIYMHLIARHQHADVVEMLKDSIIEVSGK